MALVSCIDCGKSVSSKADSCPDCGCPIEIKIRKRKRNKNINIKCVECGNSIPHESKTICQECGCPVEISRAAYVNPISEYNANGKIEKHVHDINIECEAISDDTTDLRGEIKIPNNEGNESSILNVDEVEADSNKYIYNDSYAAKIGLGFIVALIVVIILFIYSKRQVDPDPVPFLVVENLNTNQPKEIPAKTDSFIYNDKIALDSSTDLAWAIDADIAKKPMTFEQTTKFIDNINSNLYGGYNNWRLPAKSEMVDLIKRCENQSPAYFFNSHGFTNVKYDQYWTSDTIESSEYIAWIIDLNNGVLGKGFGKCFVWLVRENKSYNSSEKNSVVEYENNIKQLPGADTDSSTIKEADANSNDSDIRQLIYGYFRAVEENRIDDAINHYAISKRLNVKRKSLESTAKYTLGYTVEKIDIEHISDSTASANIYLKHILRQGRSEYWDLTVHLVKESNEWKIESTPGKLVKYGSR